MHVVETNSNSMQEYTGKIKLSLPTDPPFTVSSTVLDKQF